LVNSLPRQALNESLAMVFDGIGGLNPIPSTPIFDRTNSATSRL
jgi:hypothetical protein